jgi:hypothetical protein
VAKARGGARLQALVAGEQRRVPRVGAWRAPAGASSSGRQASARGGGVRQRKKLIIISLQKEGAVLPAVV